MCVHHLEEDQTQVSHSTNTYSSCANIAILIASVIKLNLHWNGHQNPECNYISCTAICMPVNKRNRSTTTTQLQKSSVTRWWELCTWNWGINWLWTEREEEEEKNWNCNKSVLTVHYSTYNYIGHIAYVLQYIPIWV